MVITCSACGCKSRHRQLSENGIELQFHRFPLSDPELLIKWFAAVKRKSWFPTENSYLCSEHFTDADYRPGEKRHLKEGAIPTKFKYKEKKIFKERKQVNNVKLTKPKGKESTSDLKHSNIKRRRLNLENSDHENTISGLFTKPKDKESNSDLRSSKDKREGSDLGNSNQEENIANSELSYFESENDIDTSDEHNVTTEQVIHTGGCHCGAVTFSAVASPNVKIHTCNCSICQKKQLKGFIVPKENFKVLTGHDNLTLYTFNSLVARHYFCKTCGVQSFYVPRSNPDGISVMVYCIQSDTVKNIEEIPFDGKNWEKSIKKAVPQFS